MNIAAISTLIGVAGSDVLEFELFEQHEGTILTISGIFFVLTAILHYVSRRIHCRHGDNCAPKPCPKKRRRASIIFWSVALLYAISLATFLNE